MEITGIGFFITLVSIFLFIYKYLIFKRNSLLDEEKNKTIIFNEYCGGHFDSLGILDVFHNNILTTRITLYDEFLVISYRKKIFLKYNEVNSMIISGSIPQNPYKPSRDWKRLSLSHSKIGMSKRIDLYLYDCEKVKNMIEARCPAKPQAVLDKPVP